jgi:transcriptional regulator with XRE-family HTH domain
MPRTDDERIPWTDDERREYQVRLGGRIREERIRRGMATIPEAARLLGVSPAALGSYERASRQVTIGMLARIADRYGCTVESLLPDA